MADIPQNLQQALPGLRRIVQRFWPYLRQERRLIVGSLIALLSSVILRLAEPWPLKYIFDRVIKVATNRKPRMSAFAWLDTLPPERLLLICIVALVILTALRSGCDYLNRIGFAKIRRKRQSQRNRDVIRWMQAR